jgi:hypothetical protein
MALTPGLKYFLQIGEGKDSCKVEGLLDATGVVANADLMIFRLNIRHENESCNLPMSASDKSSFQPIAVPVRVGETAVHIFHP